MASLDHKSSRARDPYRSYRLLLLVARLVRNNSAPHVPSARALMLAAALSGVFTCAAFATSFVFADARAQPRHGALLTIEARASRGDRN